MQHQRPQKRGKNHQGTPKPGKPAGAKRSAGPQRLAKAGTPHSSSQSPTRSARGPKAQASSRPPKPWERETDKRPSRLPVRDFARKGDPRSQTPRASSRKIYGHTVPPSRGRLEQLLQQYGVALPADTLDKVWQYHQILRRNNSDLDLTRLIGFETIVQRHYADCLILHKLMGGRWPSPLVDIGTGAGFPGLMIKIASPATEIILSEPRNVRVDFLNNTITELGLKNASVFGHKFTSKSFQTPVRGVITRAFEPISKTLPRLQYSLAVGGLAMFMKGPGVDEELSGPIPAGYKLLRDERYRIPATTLDRAFVVFERVK